MATRASWKWRTGGPGSRPRALSAGTTRGSTRCREDIHTDEDGLKRCAPSLPPGLRGAARWSSHGNRATEKKTGVILLLGTAVGNAPLPPSARIWAKRGPRCGFDFVG